MDGMAIYGVYNGSVIETDRVFKKDRRFLLIPVDGPRGPIDPEKQARIDRLYGSVPDHGSTLDETRAERRARQ